MLILSKENIEKVFSMREAIEASKEALKLYSQGQAKVPLRTNLDISEYNGQSLYMPASAVGETSALGVKIVSVYPKNIDKGLPAVPATMLVQHPQTGIVSALLDGTYLTQLRTAAVQGAATDLMAKSDAKIAALIGTGGQGFQQAIAMMTVRKLTELRIFDINFDRAKNFAIELKSYIKDMFDTEIIAVSVVQEAIHGADIITTVTTSKTPTFDANDVKSGAHINGVGAYTPDMIELPTELFRKTKTIVFDTKSGVLAEAGDILKPLNEGIITKDDCSMELGELFLGNKHWERQSEEITVFKTVGSAVLDVVTAQYIVEKASQLGIGQEVVF